MKYKLLFILTVLGSIQVQANRRNFYDDGYNSGDYRYRNRKTNSRKYYNNDFENVEYENKKGSGAKFYNSGLFGFGFKYLKGQAVNNVGDKVIVEHAVLSPLLGLGLGVAFDMENSLFQQIRIAGEFNWLPSGDTQSGALNGKTIEEETKTDTSGNLMLNSYFNFNDIKDGVSLYLSFGIGKWGRTIEEKNKDTVSSFGTKVGFGVSSKVSETLSIDTGIRYLVTSDFKDDIFTLFAKELGFGVSVRSLF